MFWIGMTSDDTPDWDSWDVWCVIIHK